MKTALNPEEINAEFEKVLSEINQMERKAINVPICHIILDINFQQRKLVEVLTGQIRKFSSNLIETTPAFEGMKYSQLIVRQNDHHPNHTAHGVFADVIFQYLVTHYLQEIIQ